MPRPDHAEHPSTPARRAARFAGRAAAVFAVTLAALFLLLLWRPLRCPAGRCGQTSPARCRFCSRL